MFDEPTPGADLEAPDTFQLLQAPLWPRLPLALGYRGGARWVASYIRGHEVRFFDGANQGGSPSGLLVAYRHHRTVTPHLTGAHLGSAEEEASEWLVVDTQEKLLYLARAEDARRHLERQWPHAEEPLPSEYTSAELQRLLDNLEEPVAPLDLEAERAEAIRERQANYRLMLAWLNKHGVGSP